MGLVFLSNLVDVSSLPSEFLIFSAGENPSTKGSVLFDARALELVTEQAKRHNVDFIVDLEHMSLFMTGDPHSSDARAWFALEARGSELWGVNVSWTEDGAQRLKARTQRYLSPAFYTDEWDDELQLPRVTSLINVALVSMPATYDAEPLVASARSLDGLPRRGYSRRSMKASDSIRAALAALASGDQAAALAALKAAEPEAAAPVAPAEPEVPAPAEPAEAPAPVVVETPTIAAATDADVVRDLIAASGAPDAASALVELRGLVAARQNTATAERRALVLSLIELGAETPATAWSGSAPTPRLGGEPIESLRTRVAALRATKPAQASPPPLGTCEFEGMSEVEQAALEKIKNPEHRAAFVAARKQLHARAAR